MKAKRQMKKWFTNWFEHNGYDIFANTWKLFRILCLFMASTAMVVRLDQRSYAGFFIWFAINFAGILIDKRVSDKWVEEVIIGLGPDIFDGFLPVEDIYIKGGTMRIKEIESQHRRDFMAIYECEHCGHTHKGSGYDDSHFHSNVIPDMKCPSCGKKATKNYRPLATKYPDNAVV